MLDTDSGGAMSICLQCGHNISKYGIASPMSHFKDCPVHPSGKVEVKK